MARFAALLIFLAILTGCASRHTSTYRYVVSANTRVLIPPGVKDAKTTQRTIRFPAAFAAKQSCAISEKGVAIRPHGKTLRVTIRKEQIVERPAGELASWSARYEEQGCVAPGAGLPLATRIAEALPLDPAVFHSLLHADPLRGGYIDLGPETRLKIVSPILKKGTTEETFAIQSVTGNDHSLQVDVKPPAAFLGYETVWYKAEPQAGGIGVRFQFVSGESKMGESVSPESQPRANYFQFAPHDAYFRLFFLTRNSVADHDIAILGAPTAAALEAITPGLAQNPQACKECVMIPKDVAVVPYLAVTVNGKEVVVPTGTALIAAIRASGEDHPDHVIASLQVRRPYANTLSTVTFDRGKPDILRLSLRGGEDLSW